MYVNKSDWILNCIVEKLTNKMLIRLEFTTIDCNIILYFLFFFFLIIVKSFKNSGFYAVAHPRLPGGSATLPVQHIRVQQSNYSV